MVMNFLLLLIKTVKICAFSEVVWHSCHDNLHPLALFSVSGVRVSGAFKGKPKRITHQTLLGFSLNQQTFEHEFLYTNMIDLEHRCNRLNKNNQSFGST